MKTFHLSFLLFFCFLAAAAMAQPHSDCDNSMLLTDMNPVTIDSTFGEGVADDLSGTCLSQEFAPTWLSWQIDQPGTLTFVLTALKEFDDLDFAVFRFNGNALCQEKTLVRCMAAGETVGAPYEQNLPCWGPTGLNLTETDVEELPGCINGNNNFLQFLQCQAGEQFALVVNNFSESNEGFTIEWGGTATFVNFTATDEASTAGPSVFPNPTNGLLNISGLGEMGDKRYWVSDSLGRPAMAGVLTGGSTQLDVSQLVAGMYVLKLETASGIRSFKVLVE